jgi:hypothetical protein
LDARLAAIGAATPGDPTPPTADEAGVDAPDSIGREAPPSGAVGNGQARAEVDPDAELDELAVRDWRRPPASVPPVVPPPRTAPHPPILQDWPPRPTRGLDDPTGRDLDPGGRGRTFLAGDGMTFSPPTLSGASANIQPPAGSYVPPAPSAETVAGGYLEPSGVFSSVAANGAAAAITARAGAPAPSGHRNGTVAASTERTTPDSASLFADLPFDAPTTLTGWLLAVGTGLTTLGFVLPWSTIMIGSTSIGRSYFDTWGLASPTHLVIAVVCLMGLVMSVLPNRVPGWLRTSVFGLVVGGILVGIVWPYLFEGLGYQVGVVVELIGSLVVIVGAVLSILPTRHDLERPSV